jgi:hypothetical protein
MKITCIYKNHETEIFKDRDNNYFTKLLIPGSWGSNKLVDRLLENLIIRYRYIVDNHNKETTVVNEDLVLMIEYKGEILNIDKYNPHTKIVKKYRCDSNFIPKVGSSSDLNSLIEQFEQWVDKEKVIKENKPMIKITSTYKGYPVEVKYEGEKLYSCTIKTRYGVEDREIIAKPIDHILYTQQWVIDDYKDFRRITPNERIYHVLEIEYQDSTLKAYYGYNTNESFFSNITRKEDKKAITKEDLNFTPSTNTQELIDQFISFVDSRDKHLKLNVPKLNINLEEKDRPLNSIKMSFLSTNGKVFTVPCHITEDGTIQCEPFTEENTIIGYSLIVDDKRKDK